MKHPGKLYMLPDSKQKVMLITHYYDAGGYIQTNIPYKNLKNFDVIRKKAEAYCEAHFANRVVAQSYCPPMKKIKSANNPLLRRHRK